MKKFFFNLINNIENYLCQGLLVTFVVLLFLQIILRNFFYYSIPWGDELATYAFVWFAYFGAAYATKMSAHNRVTFQFKMFPPWVETFCAVLTDLIWIGFNLFFVYMSYDFVFNKMNLFWKSQTMCVPMKYFYFILPIAFTLMTIRIIQNNYLRFVKKVDLIDPEAQALDEITQGEAAGESTQVIGKK